MMRKTTTRLITLLPIVMLLILTGCLSLAEDITPPPGAELPPPTPATVSIAINPPTNRPDPNQGGLIYLEKCAPCHGESGQGDGPEADMLENQVPALGSAVLARKSTPMGWYTMVTQGNISQFMPPFTSLSDQQRWDVVAYLYTLSAPPETVAQGERLYTEACAECHGEDGRQGAVDFTDQAFMAERSAEDLAAFIQKGHEAMPAFEEFEENELWSLAAYLRSLTFAPLGEVISAEIAAVESENQETGSLNENEPGPGDVLATGDETGKVSVNVVNASDEALPADLEITLRGYDEMEEVYSQTLKLAQEPRITFEEVPLPLDRMYFATTAYANAVYGSDVVLVEASSPREMPLEITYYPPTTDRSILHVERLHVFLSFTDEQILEIFQLYIFSNPSNQVLVPGDEGDVAVYFSIPTDASNLYVEDTMSMAYQRTANGFGIVNVYPNESPYQTVFSYQIPYEDRKLDLSVPISMDTNAVIVMAPAGGLKVKSNQLEDAGSRDFEGVSYNMYTGVNLESGSTLELSLSGRPYTGTQLLAEGDGSNTNLVIGLAGLGGALVLTGIFLWYRSRVSEQGTAPAEWADPFNGESAEDLMDAIINLDDQYRTGDLPEGAYRVRRAELKERLEEIIRNE